MNSELNFPILLNNNYTLYYEYYCYIIHINILHTIAYTTLKYT